MQPKPHPGAGVEISDVDLRTVDDGTFERIRTLFAEHRAERRPDERAPVSEALERLAGGFHRDQNLARVKGSGRCSRDSRGIEAKRNRRVEAH